MALRVRAQVKSGEKCSIVSKVVSPLQTGEALFNSLVEHQPGDDPKNLGLFWVSNSCDMDECDPRSACGTWIDPAKPVNSCGIKSGELVVLRPRFGVLVFRTLDDVKRRLPIDLTLSVKEIVRKCCEKIDLRCVSDYGLLCESTEQWLDPNKTLTEQVSEEASFLFDKRFDFVHPSDDSNHPMDIHFAYLHDVKLVPSGQLQMKEEEAVHLAALQAQVSSGKCSSGGRDFSSSLPPQYRKVKHVDDKIISKWKQLGEMDANEAKKTYHDICKKLSGYGVIFFTVNRKQKKMFGKIALVPFKLGFSSTKILVMSDDYKTTLNGFDYTKLSKRSYRDGEIVLDFGTSNPDKQPVSFVTNDGDAILSVIDVYSGAPADESA